METIEQNATGWMRSRYAALILILISFTESVFLPVIIDPFLMALIFANRARALYYTIISILASTFGGIVAYFLGSYAFTTIGVQILETYGWAEGFNSVQGNIAAQGAFLFVFIGALTPIPYKLVALTAGFVGLPLSTFLLASIIGRTLRLGMVGYLSYLLGPHAMPVIKKHTKLFAYGGLLFCLAYAVYKLWL